MAIVATSLAFLPAVAQANPPIDGESGMQMSTEPSSGGFAGSDLDGNGTLDMSEFTLYADDRAVAGDADFTAIVSSGDYETAFKLLDSDGSGDLSEAEVTGDDAYDADKYEDVDDATEE
jgi:Ca2+-binding EF-hand superfamily protein